VRLCRRRFWKGDYTEDKISAYQTLYLCLEGVAILMAPIAPFYAERLFRDLNLRTKRLPHESVHLCEFPKVQRAWIDETLERQMEIAQQVSSLVLSLRKKQKIKVRQPLQKMMIPILDPTFKEHLLHVKDLILAEVNVKEMELLENTEGILVKRIKPNFKTIGPKYGKHMKAITGLVATWTQQDIAHIEQTRAWSGNIDGVDITLSFEDFEIQAEDIPGWLVASEDGITVALDITISDELRKEGLAREVVNRIQNIRKDSGFEVTDRIKIRYQASAEIQAAIQANEEYIKNEVLAEEIVVGNVENGIVLEDGDLDGFIVEVGLAG
jgi:isoleucyl-tRNA synthetase